MKKVLIFLALLLLPIIFVSCDPSTTQSTDDTLNAEESAINDDDVTKDVTNTNTDVNETDDNSISDINDDTTYTKDTSDTSTNTETNETIDSGVN